MFVEGLVRVVRSIFFPTPEERVRHALRAEDEVALLKALRQISDITRLQTNFGKPELEESLATWSASAGRYFEAAFLILWGNDYTFSETTSASAIQANYDELHLLAQWCGVCVASTDIAAGDLPGQEDYRRFLAAKKEEGLTEENYLNAARALVGIFARFHSGEIQRALALMYSELRSLYKGAGDFPGLPEAISHTL